jgi:hypothetical protein
MEANTHLQGLPHTLEVMLMQLVCNNQLNGWNIFENRHGHICMNIRFVVGESHVGSVPASYRKISPRQAARNTRRVQEHHTQTTPQNASNKKRKFSKSSPELNRSDSTAEEEYQVSVCSNTSLVEYVQEEYHSGCRDTPKLDPSTPPHPSPSTLRPKEEYQTSVCADTSVMEYVKEAHQEEYQSGCRDTPKLDHDPSTPPHPSPSAQLLKDEYQTSVCADTSVMEYVKEAHQEEYQSGCRDTPKLDHDPFTPPHPSPRAQLPSPIEQVPDDGESLNDNIGKEVHTSTTRELSSAILCPCCNEAMTIDHECDPETDQTDDINIFNVSTQSQSTPNTQPDPDPPDCNYEAIAGILSAHTNLMFRQISINLGLPPT